jgi:hypothetical protein
LDLGSELSGGTELFEPVAQRAHWVKQMKREAEEVCRYGGDVIGAARDMSA